MKLYYSPLSPFARKVLIVLHERGLAEGAELADLNPWPEPGALTASNPISQVPSLVRDDGSSLFDSPVICAWLDTQGSGPRLIPEGEDQWRVRRLEAAADGVCENAVKLRMELTRPDGERSQTHIDRWRRTIVRALDALEGEPDPGGFDLGEIALVCMLDYVGFRHPDIGWRTGRPALEARWARLQARDSIAATRPA